MTTEPSGYQALEIFIAEVGAPFDIMSDNGKMETSKVWKSQGQLDHKKNRNKCFIQMKQDSGKITWEPAKLIK